MLYASCEMRITPSVADNIPLALQTAYADLLDRCASADFDATFSEEGVFTPKIVRGRRYWYFQSSVQGNRQQRYVGPETPELLERISRHKKARHDQRDRHTLVSTLVRSAHLPRPLPAAGEVLAALAKAGVFRLRGVLVGTIAYQTYSAMLGTRLPVVTVQTGDVDVAQFSDVSVAVGDRTPPILEVLREVDRSFRPIPSTIDARRVTTYEAAGGLRVDFLTPNRGPDTDKPRALPAFGTDAQQLRFLDFLIREPQPAVVLHGVGIYVLVPALERYALHKLIVARRRREGSAKRDKDIQQAEALLAVLTQRRTPELNAVWAEAYTRGKTWQQLLGEGLGLIHPGIRDQTLKVVGAPRSIVPGLKLEFAAPAARYDFDRDVVAFLGHAGGAVVRCAISREALEDHFRADDLDQEGRLEKFREHRSEIEHMLQTKYLSWPIQEIGETLIKTEDVPKLKTKRVARASREVRPYSRGG
jgi:hypothetical protein